MKEVIIQNPNQEGLSEQDIAKAIAESLADELAGLKKVLIIPPDFTRKHSGGGKLTQYLYRLLSGSCHVDVMPALGTHVPLSEKQCDEFFGDVVPRENIITHNWRTEVVKIGRVDADIVREVSEGLMDKPIDVEVNKRLLDGSYDRIISIGQVVPHEIIGMANYTKNILVGCGGFTLINQSHMMGAFYGMERIMGQDRTPVRRLFDYIENAFLKDLPILYMMTVTKQHDIDSDSVIHGLFIGRERAVFEAAVALSQKMNLILLDKPIRKAVVYLDAEEFQSSWLCNKAVYRTRMAMADGGELVILAPGMEKFGEDSENDRLIRKYGYIGRERILELVKTEQDLNDNLSVAAHIIHGSSDGRFNIVYAVNKMSRAEIEGANYGYLNYDDAIARYDITAMKDGMNIMSDGEEIFFISNPALGLWACKDRFNKPQED